MRQRYGFQDGDFWFQKIRESDTRGLTEEIVFIMCSGIGFF
jgi:hypothetical protein